MEKKPIPWQSVPWLAERWNLTPAEVVDHAAKFEFSILVEADGWPVEVGYFQSSGPSRWRPLHGAKAMSGPQKLVRDDLPKFAEQGQLVVDRVAAKPRLDKFYTGAVGMLRMDPLPVVAFADARVADVQWRRFECRIGLADPDGADTPEAQEPDEVSEMRAALQTRERGKANTLKTIGGLVWLLARQPAFQIGDDCRPSIGHIAEEFLEELATRKQHDKGFAESTLRERLTAGVDAWLPDGTR